MRKPAAFLLSMGVVCALSACANPAPQRAALLTADPTAARLAPSTPPAPTVTPAPPAETIASAPPATGIASWYRTGRRLHRTYTGQMLNNNAFTAASSVLPMGTMVRVGRIDDSRSVVVRVNDRMPYNHRLIDLSEIAARELGMMGCGVATVTVTPIVVASAP